MGRPKKTPAAKGELERLIANQLNIWIEASLHRFGTPTKQQAVLSRRSGVGQETIRKIAEGTQTARIDSLQHIVVTLGYSLTDLFERIENTQTKESRGKERRQDDDSPGSLHPNSDGRTPKLP